MTREIEITLEIDSLIGELLAIKKKSDSKSGEIFKASRDYMVALNDFRLEEYKSFCERVKDSSPNDVKFYPYHYGEDEEFS